MEFGSNNWRIQFNKFRVETRYKKEMFSNLTIKVKLFYLTVIIKYMSTKPNKSFKWRRIMILNLLSTETSTINFI